MSPETWRVVFSSTGDLVRAATAARDENPRSRFPMRAARWLLRVNRYVLDSLASVLLPSNCRVCAQPLPELTRISVCDCIGSTGRAEPGCCSICGEALDLASVAQAVVARKSGSAQPVRLIPLPLHRMKRRQRWFNQSALIARHALRDLEATEAGNLLRVRSTVSRTGLMRHQRRERVHGVFAVRSPEAVRDRSVVGNYVYAMGTTPNECVRVLRKAGAREIAVLIAARVYRARSDMRIVFNQYALLGGATEGEHAAAVTAVAG